MRRPYWLAALASMAVALAMRTVPLWQSPLPFNPDGIGAARLAATTLERGHLPLARMATDDLLFPPLLATVGAVLGVDPMRLAQPLSALVGSLPVLLGVAVTRRVAVRRGWSRRRAFAAATIAGLLLAVEGLYLHRSAATDEQTVGLLFVPLAAVVVARAHATGRRAWYLALAPLLVAIAPLHNLDGMVLGLVLTVATALAIADQRNRRAAPLAALTAGFWAYFAGYHLAVARVTAASIVQQTRLTEVPGLVVAWVVLVAAGAAWLSRARPRTQRLLPGLVFAGLFALLAVNAVVPVFPGTPGTHPLVLAGLLPLALPVAAAIWDVPGTVRTRPEGLALAALLAAPFVLVGVSLTASMTPSYLATAYRTTTFLHFPALILSGLGTVGAATRVADRVPDAGVDSRRAVTAALAVAVLIAAAASVPVAFGGLAVLEYKGVTTTAELEAATFASRHAAGLWASDDHLVRIEPPSGAGGTDVSTYAWVVGTAGPPRCFVLAQRSWTTVGAQFFPAPASVLARSTYRSWLRTNHVVYRGGAEDPFVGVVPAVGGDDAATRGTDGRDKDGPCRPRASIFERPRPMGWRVLRRRERASGPRRGPAGQP